jgi:membrane-anchored protein YejM (alkaline phosphatase superfamily)
VSSVVESRRPSASRHLSALAVQGIVAVVAFVVIGRGFLAGGVALPWEASLYALLALVSTAALLVLVLGLVMAAPVALARSEAATFLAVPVVFGLLTFFVQADLVIYRLYRAHVNGMILNLLDTPGGSDSFTLGRGTAVSGALLLGASVAFHVGVSWFLVRPAFAGASAAALSRWVRRAAVVLAVAVVADKAIYAWSDFNGASTMTRVHRLIPLYRPLGLREFLRETVGLTPRNGDPPAAGGELLYPRAPLAFSPGAPRPNVLIVAVEGLRRDMQDPEVMPFLSRWAATQIACERHVSGGNASRYGIFALLYGVDGTLWRLFRDEQRSPALVVELKKMGYAFRILSGTDLNYPEFRQTAFREVTDAITDVWPGDRTDRDRLQADAFQRFLEEDRRPFFSFVFFDASHQPYLYPPEDEVFRPVLPPAQLDYVKIADGHARQVPLLFNRYRNSLHYVDRQIERLVQALSQRGRLDDTLIFVCGDHGEEFGEDGLVGHNSAFDPWQVRTPMVVHLPGGAARRIARPTSHEDVVPTIFEALGVLNPDSDYTHGVSLTRADGPERLVLASWDQAAVAGPDETVVFGTETTNLDVEVIDAEGRPVPGREGAHRGDLAEVLRRMAAFRR